MLKLSNNHLQVDIRNPAEESHLLGTRYCHAGYIWQVTHPVHGPFLSGPEWPEPSPSPFNGQGLPESFRAHEFHTNRLLTLDAQGGEIPGVGTVSGSPKGGFQLLKPCIWDFARENHRMVWTTQQRWRDWHWQLSRTLILEDFSLVSQSEFSLLEGPEFELQWFAHPFWPPQQGSFCIHAPEKWPWTPENMLSPSPGIWEPLTPVLKGKDLFSWQKLGTEGEWQLAVRGKHQWHWKMSGDFRVEQVVFWANPVTFSVEPYYYGILRQGEKAAWKLRHEFPGQT